MFFSTDFPRFSYFFSRETIEKTSMKEKKVSVCSIDRQMKYGKSGNCFSTSELKNIAQVLKKEKKIGKIPESRSALQKTIQQSFQNQCSIDKNKQEACWIQQPIVRKYTHLTKSLESALKPAMPNSWKQDKFTWLSSIDIFDAMKPFEKKWKDFIFLGPFPRDCPVGIQCPLSNLSPESLLKSGKKKIGIIYNLDLHDEPGSHWVAVFIHLTKGHIEYYDSYGSPPEELIYGFMRSFAEKLNQFYKNKKVITIDFSRRRHQYGGSECGMFSMVFLLQRLQGYSLRNIEKQNLTDSFVNHMRFVMFRSN